VGAIVGAWAGEAREPDGTWRVVVGPHRRADAPPGVAATRAIRELRRWRRQQPEHLIPETRVRLLTDEQLSQL
jgi:hypothetical protein